MDNKESINMEYLVKYKAYEDPDTPALILEFAKKFVKATKGKSVYIPVSKGEDYKFIGSELTNVDYDTIRIFEDNIDNNNKQYDVVYSDLPFCSINRNSVPARIVDNSISRISEKGYALFTFAANITYGITAQRWLESLEEKGFFVNSIIDLPDGVYLPSHSVKSKLLIFSREKRERFFIGKIKGEQDVEKLINSFIQGEEEEKNRSNGIWVRKGEYIDYAAYENEQGIKRAVEKLKKAYNGEIKKIKLISSEVRAPKRKGDAFEDIEDAVYIPKLGNSPVVTSLVDLKIKPQNYFQILVNQEKVLPRFLAFALNTDAGLELRQRVYHGTTILSLNSQDVGEIEVPVPSLPMQEEVLKVNDELNILETEITRLKERLSSIPASYKNVYKELKDINNRGDKFEQWIESLPYPLATILKRYMTSDSMQQKQEMLLYFFEAYSIFAAAVLSAIYNQPTFRSHEIRDVMADYFEKASFGSWVKMDQAIAKMMREQMSHSENMDMMLNGFHTQDQSLIKQMTNADAYSVLFRASNNRNSWKGHSGISGESTYRDHVNELEAELNKLRAGIGDMYEKIRLVRQVKLDKVQGEFISRVEILTGSNPIFKKDEIIGEALDRDALYIQVLDTGETIELPPFIVMKNSPSEVKNACYFYSRVEGSNSRYVSYHFEGQPENIEEGERAFDVIKSLLKS